MLCLVWCNEAPRGDRAPAAVQARPRSSPVRAIAPANSYLSPAPRATSPQSTFTPCRHRT
jgi:hypothetical protein